MGLIDIILVLGLIAPAVWAVCGVAAYRYWTRHAYPRTVDFLRESVAWGAVSLLVALDDMRLRRAAK